MVCIFYSVVSEALLVLCEYTNVQKFKIFFFVCFWMKSLILTKAAFIWSYIQ